MEKHSLTVISIVNGTVEGVEVTESVAEKLLAEWVHRLHLEEWDIRLQWRVRDTNMFEADCVGCVKADFVSRQAVIQMLDPVDYRDDVFHYDYEQTLVHELLHLTFWDLSDSGDDLRDRLTHIMVDRMARALVDAKRKSYEPPCKG